MLNISNEIKANLQEAYDNIVNYLLTLISKGGPQISRINYIKNFYIYSHNLESISKILITRNASYDISSNFIKIITNEHTTGFNKLTIKQFEYEQINNNDVNTVEGSINYYSSKHPNIIVYMTTNINCIFFALISIEKSNKINLILKDLIYKSYTLGTNIATKKYKYHLYTLYNLVDFHYKKKSWKSLLTKKYIVLIFDGILFSLNKYLEHLTQEDFIQLIIIPAINSLCYMFANSANQYRTFAKIYIPKLKKDIVNIIKENRQRLEKEVNSIIAEIVLDEINLYTQGEITKEEKYAYKDKYIIEHKGIENIWSLISNIDFYNYVPPLSAIIYCILNNKLNKIKGIVDTLMTKSNYHLYKNEIYASIYFHYMGYFELIEFTNLNISAYCQLIIKQNTSLFNKINDDISHYKLVLNELTIKTHLDTLTPFKKNKYNVCLQDKYLLKLNLNEIQHESLSSMINNNKFIVSLEQGMGKTRTIIAEMVYLYHYYNYKNFIVILPATYIPIWQEEIQKTSKLILNKNFPCIKLISLEKYRIKNTKNIIDIINDGDNKLNKNTYMCIDESIVIKNENSKNYECCKNILNYLEILYITDKQFEYKARMTTGAIQAENIKDWNYISKFLFSLKDNSIDLDYILNSIIYPSYDEDRYKYELKKFQKLKNNVIIKKRKINQVLNVNKMQKEIIFWHNNHFKNIHNYYICIKNELNKHMSNINQIIGKNKEEEQEKTLLNLKQAVINDKICSLIKDMYYIFFMF